jgi:hypothetical protein
MVTLFNGKILIWRENRAAGSKFSGLFCSQVFMKTDIGGKIPMLYDNSDSRFCYCIFRYYYQSFRVFAQNAYESLGTVAFARSMTWIKGLRMYTYRPRSIEYKCFQFMQNQETLNLNFYFLNGILTRSRLGQLVKNFKVGMKLFRLLRSTINIRLSEWYFD